MKKQFILATMALTLMACQADAQLLKSLIKGNKSQSSSGSSSSSSKPAEPSVEFTDDAKDDFGYSGVYSMPDGKKTKFVFVREENGNVVNKIYYSQKTNDPVHGGGTYGMLIEKYKEKFNMTVFKVLNINDVFYLIQVEPDVFILSGKIDEYKLSNNKNGIAVYAKNAEKLKDYDDETAAAIFDKYLADIRTKNAEAEAAKWMRNETYAKMVGKIGFIDQYNKVAYNRSDITEKPEVFANSIELGRQSLFYRAYYKTPGGILCPGCELNTTYEIDGIKVSRIELRKTASKWSRMIKQKFVDNSFFSAAPTIVSFYENIADYAFLYCLYQNKDKFKDGKSLKMKVTLTTNQEGVDKDVLAEGTVSLLYKDANKAGFDKMIKWVEDVINE